MSTGENEQALRKIIDMTRLLSIVLLVCHFYYHTHALLADEGLTHVFVDRVIVSMAATGVFNSLHLSKLIILGLLVISLIGARGRKDQKINFRLCFLYISVGLLLFLSSQVLFLLDFAGDLVQTLYIILTSLGYLLVLAGGTLISRLISISRDKDIFNRLNESFPQEERLLSNEYSVNLPSAYMFKGRRRRSYVNFINLFRGLLVIGSPGAGKSYFIVRHIITQHIEKGFTMFLYDYKYDDLSRIAYNTLIANYHAYAVKPKFYVINFESLSHSHRCNPLDPVSMNDIADATEVARTIMLGLNREWIKKQGDFFVESPINFVTAIIWFLRKYEDGKYCTLPHVIEFIQLDYPTLFRILKTEPEVEVLINPFESAYKHGAMDQLEGQLASAKIGIARLASPQIYYVLSGNDFTLDVNNPLEPKIVCMGNNPQKQQTLGAVISLYAAKVVKLINRKHQQKCSVIVDELATLYFDGLANLLATARANKVATTLAVQDYSQLKRDYGRDQSEVIMNMVGNIISGQAAGDTAKILSERFGKIVQQRDSISVSDSGTSTSRSTQLDSAIPPSKIASLSSGEFVGLVADNPDEKIDLKVFHAELLNDHEAIKRQEANYKDIPINRVVTPQEVHWNYLKIKNDIAYIMKTAA